MRFQAKASKVPIIFKCGTDSHRKPQPGTRRVIPALVNGFRSQPVSSSWQSSLRTDGLYDYAQSIRATGLQPSYTDAQLMQESYAIDIDINGRDNAIGYTFGVAYQTQTWRFGLSGNIAPTLNIVGPTRLLTFLLSTEEAIQWPERMQRTLGRSVIKYAGQGQQTLPYPIVFRLQHIISTLIAELCGWPLERCAGNGIKILN